MTEPIYAQLMHKAESAVSRKEAKKLMNLATETMTKSSDTSRCYYNIDQLNDFLILQEQKLASAQAHVCVCTFKGFKGPSRASWVPLRAFKCPMDQSIAPQKISHNFLKGVSLAMGRESPRIPLSNAEEGEGPLVLQGAWDWPCDRFEGLSLFLLDPKVVMEGQIDLLDSDLTNFPI